MRIPADPVPSPSMPSARSRERRHSLRATLTWQTGLPTPGVTAPQSCAGKGRLRCQSNQPVAHLGRETARQAVSRARVAAPSSPGASSDAPCLLTGLPPRVGKSHEACQRRRDRGVGKRALSASEPSRDSYGDAVSRSDSFFVDVRASSFQSSASRDCRENQPSTNGARPGAHQKGAGCLFARGGDRAALRPGEDQDCGRTAIVSVRPRIGSRPGRRRLPAPPPVIGGIVVVIKLVRI